MRNFSAFVDINNILYPYGWLAFAVTSAIIALIVGWGGKAVFPVVGYFSAISFLFVSIFLAFFTIDHLTSGGYGFAKSSLLFFIAAVPCIVFVSVTSSINKGVVVFIFYLICLSVTLAFVPPVIGMVISKILRMLLNLI